MISHAMINGRSHRLMQQNSHDFAISGSPRPGTAYGLVLDGCGSKYNRQPSNNEVGAKLLGQFAAAWLNKQLAVSHEQLAMDDLLVGLFDGCLGFIGQAVDSVPFTDEDARAAFVMTHWLATLVGFVVVGETAVLFWQGDGYLCVNGDVTTLDSGNRPDYLAYRLLRTGEEVKGRTGEKITPSPFQPFTPSFVTVNRANTHWLAVATDGWQPELLAQLAEPRSSLHLQRWLNVQARQSGNFEDDGAIAIWRLAANC
ncbi:MAG: protein phosphatase 2C domain-containing protein [Ardenticatenaceae bacterium]|nr:protein phosphatase 2C domain-containing protein [Ardenticatenaceae bacterium]